MAKTARPFVSALSALAIVALGMSTLTQDQVSSPVDTSAEIHIDAQIQQALETYLTMGDEIWESSCSTPATPPDRSSWTNEMLAIDSVQQAMADVGSPICDATSHAEVESATSDGAHLRIRAAITTEFRYGDCSTRRPAGSSATDLHEIVLDTSAPTPLVIADQIINPEAHGEPGRPGGPAPKRSSDQRPPELNGTGSSSCLQPED